MTGSEKEKLLDRIREPKDLRRLTYEEIDQLCAEIRELIIETTSITGGHLASSLGAVELTVAIHRALDAPRDYIIWDVGHQCYAHKIVTGRADRFETLRQYGGVSGFPRRSESVYDVTDSGHAGASVSYGLGIALARDICGYDYKVLVVIGDGAMTSGVAYEAMNQAVHHLESNLTILLNDNEMSISENVGGLAAYLSRLRIKPGYTNLKEELEGVLGTMPGLGEGMIKAISHVKDSITHALVPGMLFESLGLKYVGPIDGHDVARVEETIREAKQVGSPVLIHAITRKGKGYPHSERSPDMFHGVSSFDSASGKPSSKGKKVTYTSLFSDSMVEIASGEPRLVAVTAAMTTGTGLHLFSERFPARFFDVGIAEQLGVNLAGGLAIAGMLPVVAIYSTFLQRAFDQLSQEICLQDLPVVFAIDRAGLVGEDGSTHHGCFDITYLRMLPNMTVMAPGSGAEFHRMLNLALQTGSPAAIRFPRGLAEYPPGVGEAEFVVGKGEVVTAGDDVALLAIGDMVGRALDVASELELKGISAEVVNARFAKPIDDDFLSEVLEGKKLAVTMENNVVAGGFGTAVMEVAERRGVGTRILTRGLPDRFVQHGPIPTLLEEVGLSTSSIVAAIGEILGE